MSLWTSFSKSLISLFATIVSALNDYVKSTMQNFLKFFCADNVQPNFIQYCVTNVLNNFLKLYI